VVKFYGLILIKGGKVMKKNFLRIFLMAFFALSFTVVSVSFAAPQKTVVRWMDSKGLEVGMPLMYKIKAEFEKENPDITLEIVESPFNGFHDKIVTLAQAKKLPEVILMQGDWVGEFAKSKIIMPIDSLVKREPANFLDQYYDAFKMRVNGKLYYLPFYGGCVCLFYNPAIFKAEGIAAPPKTWNELVEVAKKVTHPEKNQYALTCTLQTEPPTNMSYDIYPLLLQAGAKIVDKKNRAAFNSPAGVKAVEFYAELVNKYKISIPGVLSNGEKEKRGNFAADNVAMMFDGPWGAPIQKGLNPNKDFEITTLPVGVTSGTVVRGGFLGISATTVANKKKLAATWRLVKFLAGPEACETYTSVSGDLPSNRIAASRPFAKENKYMQAFLKQIEQPNAVSIPHLPYQVELNRIMTAEVQNVILGKKTAKMALDDAAAQWNALIFKK
jgi:multiple sugar transport system substrate-binding protein